MDGLVLDGRYRIGQRLGEGGMGAVWEARDLRLERPVAVKVMSGVSVRRDPRARERFEREARLLAGLNSPYIVTVHDAGEASVNGSRLLYLVMERLHGRSLEEVPAAGLPTLAEVARWGTEICRALAVAHETGVIHRDLKPANVMVCSDGLVRVLDFGIAAVLAESADHARLTSTGLVVGTPAYMAPEQIETGEYDARTDLYALGCMLYGLVAGHPPFQASALYALMRQQVHDAPRALSNARPGVPRQWDELIGELLAKDRGDRPASAAEVGRRLRALPSPAAAGPRGEGTRPPGRPYAPTQVDPRLAVLTPPPGPPRAEPGTPAETAPLEPDPLAATVPLPDGPGPGAVPDAPPVPPQPSAPPSMPGAVWSRWLFPGQRSGILPEMPELVVSLAWNQPPGSEEELEVDGSALAVDARGRVLDNTAFYFYNQPGGPDDGVRLVEPDGADAADAREQRIRVRPGNLDDEAATVVFALSLHEAAERGQGLGDLGDLAIRVSSPDGEELCAFTPAADALPGDAAGVVLGELYRTPQGWGLRALAQGFPGGLVEIAQRYGVDV